MVEQAEWGANSGTEEASMAITMASEDTEGSESAPSHHYEGGSTQSVSANTTKCPSRTNSGKL